MSGWGRGVAVWVGRGMAVWVGHEHVVVYIGVQELRRDRQE